MILTISLRHQISQFLFTRSKQIHSYPTRYEIAANFYVEISRISQWLFSFSKIGTKTRNGICSELRQLRKIHFKRTMNKLLLKILKIEEKNVDHGQNFRTLSFVYLLWEQVISLPFKWPAYNSNAYCGSPRSYSYNYELFVNKNKIINKKKTYYEIIQNLQQAGSKIKRLLLL